MKKGIKWIIIILVLILLGGLAFVGYNFFINLKPVPLANILPSKTKVYLEFNFSKTGSLTEAINPANL